jgi:hypothetical protein
MLLQRRRIGPMQAVERLVAMQAQSPRDPYVALWSRLAGFDRRRCRRRSSRGERFGWTLLRADAAPV